MKATQQRLSGADNLTVKTGNAITAKWMKSNNSRVNPPDVKRLRESGVSVKPMICTSGKI